MERQVQVSARTLRGSPAAAQTWAGAGKAFPLVFPQRLPLCFLPRVAITTVLAVSSVPKDPG